MACPGPSHSTRGMPRGGNDAEPIQRDVERGGASRDRRHDVERIRRTLLVNRTEEMDGEVERFRACPPDISDALPQPGEQTLRRGQAWFSERNREEAPHPLLRCRCGAGADRPPR